MTKFKRFILYSLRWQLSGVVLAPCIALIENPVLAAIVGNGLGACVFFWVDQYIFKHKKQKKAQYEINENGVPQQLNVPKMPECKTPKLTNNNAKTIFLICGQTACGKDSISSVLESRGYKVLKSYATRPKRQNEGDTHVFISPNEVNDYRGDIVAYTKIGEYEYFATKNQLFENDIYIIDYEGIKYLKSKLNDDNLRFITIFINVSDNIRNERLENRKDNPSVALKRILSELKQFNELKLNADFDYSVCNYDLAKASDIVGFIMREESI